MADKESLDEWRNWDAKSREKAAAALQEAMSGEKRVWYCKRGRECDGKPHDQYTYRHARGDQWPPPGTDWLVWGLLGGRGSGKTRSGSEWTRKKSETTNTFGIIGPTTQHVREVMVEDEYSGLLSAFDRAKVRVLWEPSKHKITLPNDHIIRTFTAEEPERLRGRNLGSVWLDEPAHMPLIEAVWDNMMLALRQGNTQILVTTTPLPTKWMKEVVNAPDTVVVKASTYVNLDNLAPAFRKKVLEKYEGTRLGRQELYGDILEDIEGALWNWGLIEDNRDLEMKPEWMDRIVVGIDPAGTSRGRDETGVVVVGIKDEHLYVLGDYSGHYTPNGWANAAWNAYDHFQADAIVAEKNYGGEMVMSTLRNVRVDGNAKLVQSRRGKQLRAEPIVSMYEQGKVHHVDAFEDLETQMVEWVPDRSDSPDRVDALVHAATELARPAEITSIAVPRRAKLRSTAKRNRPVALRSVS